MLEQAEQRAAAASHVEHIQTGTVTRSFGDERNMVAKREFSVNGLQLFQSAGFPRVPPIVRGIEACNFGPIRHRV